MVYKCPKGSRIFTVSPHRWCPFCEQDYIPAEETAEELKTLGYIEDCEENQWLFFDLPLTRAATEQPAATSAAPFDDTLIPEEGPSSASRSADA